MSCTINMYDTYDTEVKLDTSTWPLDSAKQVTLAGFEPPTSRPQTYKLMLCFSDEEKEKTLKTELLTKRRFGGITKDRG